MKARDDLAPGPDARRATRQDGSGSGDFERVILENVNARAHFLVLLTPSALERSGEPTIGAPQGGGAWCGRGDDARRGGAGGTGGGGREGGEGSGGGQGEGGERGGRGRGGEVVASGGWSGREGRGGGKGREGGGGEGEGGDGRGGGRRREEPSKPPSRRSATWSAHARRLRFNTPGGGDRLRENEGGEREGRGRKRKRGEEGEGGKERGGEEGGRRGRTRPNRNRTGESRQGIRRKLRNAKSAEGRGGEGGGGRGYSVQISPGTGHPVMIAGPRGRVGGRSRNGRSLLRHARVLLLRDDKPAADVSRQR